MTKSNMATADGTVCVSGASLSLSRLLHQEMAQTVLIQFSNELPSRILRHYNYPHNAHALEIIVKRKQFPPVCIVANGMSLAY